MSDASFVLTGISIMAPPASIAAQLREIAACPTSANIRRLEALAVRAAALERFADEVVADAQEDDQIVIEFPNVVSLAGWSR